MEAALVTGLLVLVRMAAVIAGLPIFATQGTPKQAVLVASLGATLVITPTLPVIAAPASLSALMIAVVFEVLYGSLLALGVRVTFTVAGFAGELMGLQMGLAMATLFDPLQRQSTSIIGTLIGWLSGLAFLSANLHLRVIEILGRSFDVVPPGSFVSGEALLIDLTQIMGQHFAMGVQLSGPLLAMVFTINVVVAILARLAPRMNVFFSIGLTATTVAGLLLIWAALPWLLVIHLAWIERAVARIALQIGV